MKKKIQKACNPVAKPLRESPAAGGKARLITFHSEETECNAQTG